MSAYTSIDEYIALFPEDLRKILIRVRQTIREAAPDAEERIRWQMPTYWQQENLVHFAAHKSHLGFYPGENGIREFVCRLDTEGYAHSKGAIQFPYKRPIPYDLIREITLFRLRSVSK